MIFPDWMAVVFTTLFIAGLLYLDHRLKYVEKRIRVLMKIELDRSDKARKKLLYRRLLLKKNDWKRDYK